MKLANKAAIPSVGLSFCLPLIVSKETVYIFQLEGIFKVIVSNVCAVFTLDADSGT